MPTDRFRTDEIELLLSVLKKRAGSRWQEFMQRAADGTLSASDREFVCECIGAEFTDVGIGEDNEPTPLGTRLERLLDIVNRSRIQPRVK